MLIRIVALTLVSLLMQASYVAAGQNQNDTKHADKMRAAVARAGSCPKGKIEVTLTDNTKLKGCVMDWADDQFSLVNLKTGQLTKVTYPQVAAVRRQGPSLGKNLVWLGVAVAPMLLVVGILASSRD